MIADAYGTRFTSTTCVTTTAATRASRKSFTTSALYYLTVAAAVRPNFGTDQQVGTPGLAALFTSFTGTDRAISVIGEGPKVQPVPPVQSVRLALANAWAPDKLLYVTDLLTSRNQKGSRATLVDP